MRIARIIALGATVILVLTLAALADTCPNCGGETTDEGRCPYCNPKPTEAGQ